VACLSESPGKFLRATNIPILDDTVVARRLKLFYRKDPTMETTPEQAVAALLREAQTAHAAYETDVLGGVFDEDWPAWYAAYLLDHGLDDRLPGGESLDVATLTAMLARLAADYERGEQASPWPDVYARGIVAAFRGSSGGEESAPPASLDV
jgi:hypothetical protein